MAARHQSMGRSLSYGWVGGFLTETKVMQSSSSIIYIQLSIINEQSFIIDHYQLAFITSDYVINY